VAVVMVTGASAGLGAEIAKQFARRGDQLILVARRETLLKALKEELIALGASGADYRLVDLADAHQVQSLAQDLPKLGVDVLINNAALGHWDYVWDTAPDVLNAMLALNVAAVATLTAAFSQFRHKSSARLMNVASGAGYALFEEAIAYSATKYFVTALTEGLNRELASQNHPMRAQLLAPGPIATEFLINSLEGSKKIVSQDALSGVQFHTAEEVAELAMQLFDSEAMVGAVQPDMSFVLSDGLHAVGKLGA